jgi:hypothetical protein
LMFLNEIGTNLPADEYSDWGLMSEERKKRKESAKRSCITAILCMKQYSKLIFPKQIVQKIAKLIYSNSIEGCWSSANVAAARITSQTPQNR